MKNILSLNKIRGGDVGVKFAEAFYQIRKLRQAIDQDCLRTPTRILTWLGPNKMFVSDVFIYMDTVRLEGWVNKNKIKDKNKMRFF